VVKPGGVLYWWRAFGERVIIPALAILVATSARVAFRTSRASGTRAVTLVTPMGIVGAAIYVRKSWTNMSAPFERTWRTRKPP
jgi:hypothetical protein